MRVRGQEIAIKVSRLGGEAVTIQPEYEDCLKASAKTRLPLKEVSRLAVKAFGGPGRAGAAKES